ncbi:hypothetical protein HMPREF1521_1220 [Veillonella sp. AS16]|nr:hypothetical protein HMPREF1521_1220 [Veillonella sp. AS16]
MNIRILLSLIDHQIKEIETENHLKNIERYNKEELSNG